VTQITVQFGYQRCHRLIAANLVPGRDGQPLHLYAHVDLASLATAGSAAGGSLLESRWSLARTGAGPRAWCPAAQLRTRTLDRPFTARSQPLDLGTPTPIIPPHLRRAVTLRDQHCQFPGCTQPPAVCQIHHLTPRAHGGPTALGNLTLLCRFHHLTVIHRWAWTLTRHADGTTTAVSPDGRTLHSHSPPGRAA
jgi:hypothetical protein